MCYHHSNSSSFMKHNTFAARIWFAITLMGVLACSSPPHRFQYDHGGIIRGDIHKKTLALVFTGGDFADGGTHISEVLKQKRIKAGFFFTGDFYRNPANQPLIRSLIKDGHYLGPHSDKHLLYAPWHNRDSSLVTREQFISDLEENYRAMQIFHLKRKPPLLFIPPYEWYNLQHSQWAQQMGVTLFNFTPGTSSHADYTTPDMENYRSSEAIYNKILEYEEKDPHGLNGFILLLHLGTDPQRTDKFYWRLGDLIDALRHRGYRFVRIDGLLRS